MRKRYEDETVDLVELARQSPGFTLTGFEFEECTFTGPALVVPTGDEPLVFRQNGIDAAGLWVVPMERKYVGGIGINGCRFIGCDMTQIGIAGSREFLAQFFGDEAIPRGKDL